MVYCSIQVDPRRDGCFVKRRLNQILGNERISLRISREIWIGRTPRKKPLQRAPNWAVWVSECNGIAGDRSRCWPLPIDCRLAWLSYRRYGRRGLLWANESFNCSHFGQVCSQTEKCYISHWWRRFRVKVWSHLGVQFDEFDTIWLN